MSKHVDHTCSTVPHGIIEAGELTELVLLSTEDYPTAPHTSVTGNTTFGHHGTHFLTVVVTLHLLTVSNRDNFPYLHSEELLD